MLELNKNQNYKVQLYPGVVILDGKYLDKLEETHIFEHKGDKEKEYILVEDKWISEEEGVITYKNISSFSIQVINKKNSFMIKGLQKLIELQ